jgi:hypothetical protein
VVSQKGCTKWKRIDNGSVSKGIPASESFNDCSRNTVIPAAKRWSKRPVAECTFVFSLRAVVMYTAVEKIQFSPLRVMARGANVRASVYDEG